MKPSIHRDSYLLPLIIAVVSVVSMVIGMRLQEALVRDGFILEAANSDDKLTAIYETTEHISSKYYGNPIEPSFTDEVIEQIINQLDPYSHYFKSEQDEYYNKYMKGLYAGIGIEFVEYQDSIFCYDVVEGSPAHKSGISIGDIILQVDSAMFSQGGDNLDSLIDYLHLQDQTMLFTVKDSKHSDIKLIELTPDDISLPLLDHYILSNEGALVSYIKIHRFYKSIYKDMMQALEKHKNTNGVSPSSLIIDVRDNPGGVVEETVKILNQLFDKDNLNLLETKSRNSQSQVYKSNGRSFLNLERIVVICNENSASASEILAGVLQDHNKAVVLGAHTYGKGLIQQNYDLSNNGSINLSIGEYILPSGRSIYRNNLDTTFLSVDGRRSLPEADKGIGVDIALNSCEPSEKDKMEIKKLIAAQKAWSLEARKVLFDSSLVISDQVRSDSTCDNQYIQRLKWQALDKVLPAGDTLDIDDIDLHMQTALQVILESDFAKRFEDEI